MEKILEENNHFSSQLRETRNQMSELEEKLQAKTTEVSTYQDMLEQSQGQYIVLEKKYYKAKKIIKGKTFYLFIYHYFFMDILQ